MGQNFMEHILCVRCGLNVIILLGAPQPTSEIRASHLISDLDKMDALEKPFASRLVWYWLTEIWLCWVVYKGMERAVEGKFCIFCCVCINYILYFVKTN